MALLTTRSVITKRGILRNIGVYSSKISSSNHFIHCINYDLFCKSNPIHNKLSFQSRFFAGPPQKPAPGQGVVGKFVFHLKELTKRLPDQRILFEDVSTAVYYGAKIGIIGINGSGKSSLLKIIAGEDTEYEGEFKLYKGYSVGYLAQEPQLIPDLTVEENILEGVDEKTLNDPDTKRKIERAIDALRCPPGDSEVTNLSGGERRRVALCKLLIKSPDILLLDEPTNHLDAESVAWLERYLTEFKGTVLAITHDRYFLDNVAGYILEIDNGQFFPFKGNYTSWLLEKQRRVELESKKEVARNKIIQKELEWIRQGAKARQAKSKARISSYEKMLAESQKEEGHTAGTIEIPPGPRLGDVVVEAKNLSLMRGDKLLFKDLNFIIPPGAIVGIIGPNGAGKTSLFNIIVGEEEATSGSITLGKTVQLAYVSQIRSQQLDPDNTVYEEISEGRDSISIGNRIVNMRGFVGSFNFRGTSQSKLVKLLSGGERNRVQLAKILKNGANLILLDEPTNDLDIEVLSNLENAIQEFAGSAMIISHDRYFLDKLCTHIIAFEGDSNVVFFNGNYSDYIKDKIKRLGEKAQPSRIRYRKIETL